MTLYPTETLYALGVHALDSNELSKLFRLKERDKGKAASWLVRNMEDVEKYAEVPPLARTIASQFLPGSLTLVLKAKINISNEFVASDRTIAFRISSDPIAQKLIAEFMEEHNAPLTCTSANISGAPTLPVPGEILQQFGPNAYLIRRVIDDGPRKGLASTIVRVLKNRYTVLREGDITEQHIHNALKNG